MSVSLYHHRHAVPVAHISGQATKAIFGGPSALTSEGEGGSLNEIGIAWVWSAKMSTWIHKNGQTLGPFDDAQMLGFLKDGFFSYEDLACRDGGSEWIALSEIYPRPRATDPAPSIMPPPMATPPVAADHDRLLWEGRPWRLIQWFNRTKYAVTNTRVTAREGLVSKWEQSVRIRDIRSINLRRSGIFDTLMGIATLEFITSGDRPEVVFERVKGASEVKALVQRRQNELA